MLSVGKLTIFNGFLEIFAGKYGSFKKLKNYQKALVARPLKIELLCYELI